MTSASETALQLRESLRSGTLTLRDLDNKRRAGSRSKRRRNKKEDKRAASNPRNSGIADQEDVQEIRNNIPSRNPKRGLEPKKTGNNQNRQENEKMVRSLLDAIIEEAYLHCAAIDYSVTKDHAEAVAVGLMSTFSETKITCRALQQQARQIQESDLCFQMAVDETLDDLFVIAAHGGFPIPTENCYDAPICPQLREFEDPPNKFAQQAMLDGGEEAVENPISLADSNCRIDSLEQGVDSNELLVDEDEKPLGGWRRYICCIGPPKSKQKKEKTGFISRLRNVFKR